ncbi:MAG: hypothetical protein WBP79_14870 [Candidatus Acidiferrales bacterium]
MMLLGKIVLGITGTALAGTGLLFSEGAITVNVVERQPERHHIYIFAPALIVPIGMHFVPKEHLAPASREIKPWLPTIRAAVAQLRECEDIVFVEVKNAEEHVRVAKSGADIVVDVDSQDDTVHVSAPIRAISSSIEELAAASTDSRP